MLRPRQAPARVLAVLALVAAVIALIVVVADSTGGGSGHRTTQARGHEGGGKPKESRIPPTYKVQSGDSLGLIAQRTGVSVARIKALNPGIDELNLPIGAKLKLR